MQQKSKRSRLGVLAIGALVGSVLSVGVAAGTASAKPTKKSNDITVVLDDPRVASTSQMSGIRW